MAITPERRIELLERKKELLLKKKELLNQSAQPFEIQPTIEQVEPFEPTSTGLLERGKEELAQATTPKEGEGFLAGGVKGAVTGIKGAISTVGGLASLASEKAIELSGKGATKLGTLIEQFKGTVTPEQAQQTFLEIVKEPEFFDEDEQSKANIINLVSSFLVPAGIVGKGATVLGKLGRGAGAGVIGATTGEVQLEGELPTPEELAIGAGVGGVVGAIPGVAKAISKRAFPTEDIESIVGKIVQGKKKDIPKAVEALKKIDTVGIDTYEGLRNTITEKGKFIAGQVDTRLLEDTRTFGLDDLVKTTKVGEKEIKTNFVNKALDQLKKHADDIDDDVLKAEISEFSDKFTNKTANLKDVNDLARKHNIEISSKAFSKTGEPLGSINKQSFENIRKGTKETVRDLLPDDTTRILDKEFSDLKNTERLIFKMEEKVNALQQKISKRGLIEEAFRGLGRIVDVSTFGGPRAFLTSFLPSNIGNKVNNSLDLQESLSKNLKLFEKLEKATDDKTIVDIITQLIKIEPGVAGKAVTAIGEEKPNEKD